VEAGKKVQPRFEKVPLPRGKKLTASSRPEKKGKSVKGGGWFEQGKRGTEIKNAKKREPTLRLAFLKSWEGNQGKAMNLRVCSL